jgi:HD-GYP domain-containing protein (c-di-GMP phosphodiesterase class II)
VADPQQVQAERLIVQLSAAIHTRALYSEQHPRVTQAAQSVLGALTAACSAGHVSDVTFLVVGDDLAVDQRPMRKGSLYQQSFVDMLRRRGVERLTLARGLTTGECAQFLTAMAGGGAPVTTDHIVVGRVEIDSEEEAKDAQSKPEPITPVQVEGMRDAFVRFKKERRASIHKMEEMVWSLMESLARSTREALPLAPLKNHDEYTFIHSVNVSLLVLAQGRSLGIQGPMLHAMGVAALLHDVGKLAIPLEVLNKPGKLEGPEWQIMTTHAELGAWQLSGVEDAAPLSILVAFEHHLRFDGGPSYPTLKTPRRPNLASQLTSIADTFDAVSTIRPYKKAFARPACLAILRERAGTFHDPFLVGNFHRLLGVNGDAGTPGPTGGSGT